MSITIETYLGVWIVCLTDQEQLKLNQPMQNSVVSKLRDQFLCHKSLLNKSVKIHVSSKCLRCIVSFVVLSFCIFCFFFFFFFFAFLVFVVVAVMFRGLIANYDINEKLIIQYQYSGGFICDFNSFSAVTKTPKESHSYRKCSSFRR